MFTPKVDRIEYGGALLDGSEQEAIMRVIHDQGGRRWTVGEECNLLEKELAQAASVKRAVLTNSGSSALLLAMTSLHLPKGSKVIIPATTFPTAFNVIVQNNLVPVVVDVDLDTFNLDYKEVEKAMKQYPDIKAIIAVDISGNIVNLPKIREIVGKDVIIILDNCDGFGSKPTKGNDKFVDGYADISCASFHAAHIITMGEGGAVLTNNELYANRAKKLREWGRVSGTDTLYTDPKFPEDYRERYVYDEIGYNIKPLELQCAMGRVQLRKLPDFMHKRMLNHQALEKVMQKYPNIKPMKWDASSDPCWMHFAFRVVNMPRGKVMDYLEANNIETRTVFSGNILLHPAYKDIEAIQIGKLHNANQIMREGMFIGVHPSMTPAMIQFIDKCMGEVCSL